MELYSLTIKEAGEKLKAGEITSVELTEAIFARIDEVEAKVGSYITLCKDKALEMAKVSDERRKNGKILSIIDGVPIAVKDLFLTKDVKTTAGSRILEDFIPINESTVTQKLWDAGAVLIGKTNLDQFAMGSSTETSAYNTSKEFNSTTRNAWDLDRVPGGSSGGSASAVAADECIGAIGTDTGGSIRQPAGFSGITGLKPTYGRVSRYATIAMASSLDQAGPMTKTVEDSAILLNIISGHDKFDSTSGEIEVPDYFGKLNDDIKDKKIGVPEEFFGEGLDPEVDKIIKSGLDKMKELGAEIVPISMPMIKHALAVYYIIMPAEVSSNLARYDGVRYGLSIIKGQGSRAESQTLEQVYEKSRAEGFGAEAKRRIMLGSYVLSAGYYDAYYKKALKVRTLVKKEFDEAFKKVDIIVAPTYPTVAFKFGEKSDPLKMYMSDIMTVPINLAGIPSISIPAGFVDEGGKKLPVGMQIIGPMWGEQDILNAGYAFQSNTNYHLEKPNL